MNYRIVIPSRTRPQLMKNLLEKIPTATIVVHESEKQEYAKVVPKKQLKTHNAYGIASIRQWILDNFNEKTIVMVDDDFNAIYCNVGSKQRKYTDWQSIKQVIENSINITRDLGISLFTWERRANPMWFKPHDPIQFVEGYALSACGINTKEIKFDQNLSMGMEDTDYALQTLLKYRVIYTDTRFYWDFGVVGRNSGGLQGIRTKQNMTSGLKYFKQKWGKWVKTGNKRKVNALGKTRFSEGFRILVKRRQPTA